MEMNERRNGIQTAELDTLLSTPTEIPLTEQEIHDTTCGIWICKGKCLQMFANKTVYTILYGLIGCLPIACYCYYTGTISTLEKRFKLSSKKTGIIAIGGEVSLTSLSLVLSYYAGHGHRPRWLSFGTFCSVIFCFLSFLPHLIYGPGNIIEYQDVNVTNHNLCKEPVSCETDDGTFAPVVILFIAHIILGIGTTVFYTVGVAYMDDNVKKSESPFLLSVAFFFRMLGPAVGYAVATICLKIYISPSTEVDIESSDPRWIGAWWLGWIILVIPLIMLTFVIGLFPKILPDTIKRKRMRNETITKQERSFKHFMISIKRILTNKVIMFNNLAAIFYVFGYMPYWLFMPKYIEIQYRQTASAANFITGSVGLVCFALGIIAAGFVISKLKPGARALAAWNIFVSTVTVFMFLTYAFLGCDSNFSISNTMGKEATYLPCNSECSCEYVKYSPVCSETGTTYISACHAGCQTYNKYSNGTEIFSDCSCIVEKFKDNITMSSFQGGSATQGPCDADCQSVFYMFIAVVCIVKFIGSSEIVANFLISTRSVKEEDKSLVFGFGETVMSLFAFLPAPILFGYIFDQSCLVWGKTCTGKGNCWLYDAKSLRYTINFTAAFFIAIGTLFDVVVWYYSKDIVIFDEIKDKKSNNNEDNQTPEPNLLTQ